MKLTRVLLVAFLIFSIMNANAQLEKKQQVLMNHQAIYVTDLQKSAAFYKNIIGLEATEEPFKIGKHAWFKTGPKTTLHIILGADKRKDYYKNNHMCFTVSSFDDFLLLLKKNNISYEDVNGKKEAYSNRVGGVKQIWLQDPDGYWIEINNDPLMFH